MISTKYKDIYDKFIEAYKEIHVNPWHEISEDELENIVKEKISNTEINDIYSFKNFMDNIIKRLSGLEDAHTKLDLISYIPIIFRIFGDNVLVSYPYDLKGSKLLSINDVSITQILNELEDVITYGTEGRRVSELEKSLFNYYTLSGLPSLKGSDTLTLKIKTLDNKEVTKEFIKNEKITEDAKNAFNKYLFGDNGNYRIEEDSLIYVHSSVQQRFKETIENSINKMKKLDLSNINKIIIDLRGNWGGNSALNKILIDFLLEHNDKQIITLTDYRIFSAGRYAIRDLANLGSIFVGSEISTPINCYGNSHYINIDNLSFSISEHYYHPFMGVSISSKEQYNSTITEEILKPYIFKPDIYIETREEDFINDKDPVLEYAKTLDNTVEVKHKL